MAVCREGTQRRDRKEDVARWKAGRTAGTLKRRGTKKGGHKVREKKLGRKDKWRFGKRDEVLFGKYDQVCQGRQKRRKGEQRHKDKRG